jgi:hypothetical protein
MPSEVWIGERASRCGSVDVRPHPSERGRAEPLPNLRIRDRRRYDRFGVCEVSSGSSETVLDEADRGVELAHDLQPAEAREDRVRVRVRAHRDETGGPRVAKRGPRERLAMTRERTTLLDEVRRQVQRDRHAVLDEHGKRDLDEVVGSVVERDHDAVILSRVAHESVDGVVEAHRAGFGQHRHLLVEQRRRKINLTRGTRADAVVEEHHDAPISSVQTVERDG